MDSGSDATSVSWRKAQPEDIDAVFDLYMSCRSTLREKGLDQWQDGYPFPEDIRKDIELGSLWLMEDDKLIAVGAINQEFDVQHTLISWSAAPSFRFIHRLAVSPAYQGLGMGKLMMKFIEDELRARGIRQIRLDTYSLNTANLVFYAALGYSRVAGEVYFSPHEAPFYCFEKMI
jgi:ribosomal protein S18 acetylase RimI-like enzyme